MITWQYTLPSGVVKKNNIFTSLGPRANYSEIEQKQSPTVMQTWSSNNDQ